MQTRKLGTNLEVSSLGLGCMGMSFSTGIVHDEDEMIALIHKAVDLGVTFFDTAEVYGPFTNETLVAKALSPIRDKVKIATKFGFNCQPGLAPHPEPPRSTAARAHQGRLRSLAQAPQHRYNRPLLPAPSRSQRPDRRRSRSRQRPDRRGQGQELRPL